MFSIKGVWFLITSFLLVSWWLIFTSLDPPRPFGERLSWIWLKLMIGCLSLLLGWFLRRWISLSYLLTLLWIASPLFPTHCFSTVTKWILSSLRVVFTRVILCPITFSLFPWIPSRRLFISQSTTESWKESSLLDWGRVLHTLCMRMISSSFSRFLMTLVRLSRIR